MAQNDIDIISIEDKEYPSLLREIYNPPLNLYVRGNKKILNDVSVAIIGCRDATEYGKNVAEYFSYNIAQRNVNIVSGLAKGIDSFAHKGAIKANGITTAVLGNGLDIIYPNENIKLAQNILNSSGAIISEYPLGTRTKQKKFPSKE